MRHARKQTLRKSATGGNTTLSSAHPNRRETLPCAPLPAIVRVGASGRRWGRPCMSDIFISYARSTATQAQTVAEALRALGYDVWRDDELPAHRAYAEVIEG